MTLPCNNTCGLTVTAELILGCLGLCIKSSSCGSYEVSCAFHRKKNISVKHKCSESESCLPCRVVAGYLVYSIQMELSLKDLNASLALINTLNWDCYLQAFNLGT